MKLDYEKIKAANLEKKEKAKKLKKQVSVLSNEIEQKKFLLKQESDILLPFLKEYSKDAAISVIAERLDIPTTKLVAFCKQHCIEYVSGHAKEETTLGIELLIKDSGKSLSELAKEFNLSRQRVHQIKNRLLK